MVKNLKMNFLTDGEITFTCSYVSTSINKKLFTSKINFTIEAKRFS